MLLFVFGIWGSWTKHGSGIGMEVRAISGIGVCMGPEVQAFVKDSNTGWCIGGIQVNLGAWCTNSYFSYISSGAPFYEEPAIFLLQRCGLV